MGTTENNARRRIKATPRLSLALRVTRSGDALTSFPVASRPLSRRDEDSNIRDNEWNKERNYDFSPDGGGRLAPKGFVKVIDREEYRSYDESD
jgi:hypothetical protein